MIVLLRNISYLLILFNKLYKMKKIKILLLIIITFLTISIWYSNRDGVSYVRYWATVHNPLKIKFLFDNQKTNTPVDHYIDYSNLFYLANFRVLGWWCSISKWNDSVKIRYTSRWYAWQQHLCKIEASIDVDDIKDYVDRNLQNISPLEKIALLDWINVWFEAKINVYLKIMTTSNWWWLSDYTADFPMYRMKYYYSYWSWRPNPPKEPDCKWIIWWNTPEKDCVVEPQPIVNTHQLPIIWSIEKVSSDVDINYHVENNYLWKFVMLSDIPEYSGLILLWRSKILRNWTHPESWIKRVVMTVMNSSWTQPLSNNCIYNWIFRHIKYQWEYIPLYITNQCKKVRTVGNYKLSFQYIDDTWSSSPEYTLDLQVIPWQVDPEKTTVTITRSTDPVYGDAFSKYLYNFTFRDKYDNIIKNRDIWDYIKLISNDIKVDEFSQNWKATYSQKIPFRIDNNWNVTWTIISYNNWSEELNFKIKANKVWASIPSSWNSHKTYKKIDGNIVFEKNAWTKSFENIFESFNLIKWATGSVLWFWTDIPLNLKIKVKNYNSSEKLKNVKIKFTPIVTDKNWNKVDVEIRAWTWYENRWQKLLDWTYSLNDISKNSENESWKFVIRIENNDWIISNCKLWWTWWIIYTLNWEDWEKTIKKKVSWSSNLEIKYWWVYIEWLFSSKVKWLYELLRKSSGNNTMAKSSAKSINTLKTKTYNNIIKNVTISVRWVAQIKDNPWSTLKWIYYKKWDITLDWWKITWKTLVYADWWNVYIKWNLKKDWWILTIVAKSVLWKWWYVFIDNNVTNIDAIIVADKGVFSTVVANNWKMQKNIMKSVVKWEKNIDLNNQLLIYGVVISKWNTIWWSIKIWHKYVLPWWKVVDWTPWNFYEAWIYDLNYLRRYHYLFNKWKQACAISSNYWPRCTKVYENKYWTYPVIIVNDSSIKTMHPYWF